MRQMLSTADQALRGVAWALGRRLAEFVFCAESAELAGPDSSSEQPDVRWAWEPGWVYIGQRRVEVERPRLRRGRLEIALKSYQTMRHRDGFCENLLAQALEGLATHHYQETLTALASAFGVALAPVCDDLLETTSQRFESCLRQGLEDLVPIAVFANTVHLGGKDFVVALGVQAGGEKRILGLWNGDTADAKVAELLLSDLEERGLTLSNLFIFVLDGGKGLRASIKQRYGAKRPGLDQVQICECEGDNCLYCLHVAHSLARPDGCSRKGECGTPFAE